MRYIHRLIDDWKFKFVSNLDRISYYDLTRQDEDVNEIKITDKANFEKPNGAVTESKI
ncbi:MAG: hypothetical protein QXV17_08380 [Candidatus Micrarchaeaceae archaeon]